MLTASLFRAAKLKSLHFFAESNKKPRTIPIESHQIHTRECF
ncbi:hypothetical protein HMPREF0880_01844 [Yokenella regensburgei ATCC 43003]|nr:hypothetical protein HMPREF0880_01844 [Yokenella regensburgei ATCC 43003]